jgi:hypothetical protein
MNPKNNQKQSKDQYEESESIILDLETLSLKYRNLLIEYENAVSNYINYLQQEAATPCGPYVGNSTNINQTCINKVWQGVGCGAGTIKSPPPNPPASLNDIINWAFRFSKMTDYNHRMQCYGNPGNSYIILCVGTDGGLYSRQGLDAPWQKVNDNVGANLKSICIGNDGKTIYGTTIINTIWKKSSWDAPTWDGLPNTHNCCVYSLAQGQDGTFVGVGTDNVLWTNTSNFQNDWTRTPSPTGEYSSAITIAPDGSLFAVGSDQRIWKKNNYKNLPSQEWQFQGYGTCCVKSITIAPDGSLIGIGTDDQLYTKASYKDLSTPWQGPWSSENNSCCAISVAAVVNPNYNAANYNQTSSPNYNINNQPLVSVPGSTYWGSTSIAVNNSPTLQECQASCANTPNCTGATFNATAHGQPMCWLRGGDGNIAGGLDTDYAIVSKGKQMLENIQSINQQLQSVNERIQNKTNTGQPLFNEQTLEKKQKTSELISQFLQLNEDRNKIKNMIKEYETLDEQQTQGNLKINQNYYSFVLLLFLAAIVIIGLWYFGRSNINSNTNLDSSSQNSISSMNFNTNYIVIATFLIALLLFGVYTVLSKTNTNISGLSNLLPKSLPQLKLSKFGWN